MIHAKSQNVGHVSEQEKTKQSLQTHVWKSKNDGPINVRCNEV